ncbi:hypothetical protein Leryth_023740 [Lithospermum erythrorhizon]|nr:hypothetical protein Leryth_023740 [Lithospermum erythrorhizon]
MNRLLRLWTGLEYIILSCFNCCGMHVFDLNIVVRLPFSRVPCFRKGGLRFQFQGNGYWLLVYVMNVGGGGDIATMWVKGTKTGWINMSHNWGASYQLCNWEASTYFQANFIH